MRRLGVVILVDWNVLPVKSICGKDAATVLGGNDMSSVEIVDHARFRFGLMNGVLLSIPLWAVLWFAAARIWS